MSASSAYRNSAAWVASVFWLGCGANPAPVQTTPAEPSPLEMQVSSPAVVLPEEPAGLCDLAKDVAPLARSVVKKTEGVSPDNLRATISVLADPVLHGRAAGSEDNRRVARWLADRFAGIGLPPVPEANHCVAFERGGVRDQNVVAYLHRNTASDAPVVLVGAHYDAQGHREADVYPGADDNASGVAALLEIARISAGKKAGPDMVFVAFGAEERGLLGAKAYVAAPSIPLPRVKLMINLDMVGRPVLDGSPLRLLISRADETLGYVIGPQNRQRTEELLQHAAQREDRPLIGIPEVVLTRLGFGSDSVPFSPHVPTIFLSTGDHRDYHQPTDTPDKIDYEQISRAVRLTLAIVEEEANESQPHVISK